MYNDTIKLLNDELERIQKVIDLTARSVGPKLSGSLERRPYRKKDSYRVVHQCSGKKIRKKINDDEVARYIRNHFAHARLKILKKNRDVLDEAIRQYQDDSSEAVYAQLADSYRHAGRECCMDRRYEELKAWANEQYETNPAPFSDRATRACDNRIIRSKGECIWYNELYHAMIPFRYDSLLKVTNDIGELTNAYPDFLIQCYDGTMLMIEHLGWLGDMAYAERTARKMHYYLGENYILGDNFFLTSDNKDGGTNSEMILRLITAQIEPLFYRGAEDYL